MRNKNPRRVPLSASLNRPNNSTFPKSNQTDSSCICLHLQKNNVILVGKSGSGKSTLVNNLYPLGQFISDDYLAISFKDEDISLVSSYPGIRLFNNQMIKEVHPISENNFLKTFQLNKILLFVLIV